MKQLVFVTRNKHKLLEVSALLQQYLNNKLQLLDLNDVGFELEIPEPEPTIQANAIYKAQFFYQHKRLDCFADDTGLEVEALDGLPGVHSARFPYDHDYYRNMMHLLDLMKDKKNRAAQFRTVIALIWEGQLYTFEGIVRGYITTEPRGDQGFGYDPVFIPQGYEQTFAQMPLEQKNRLSHRYQAVKKMAQFLRARLM
jgi:XTP/dITP diphosphohydrolase